MGDKVREYTDKEFDKVISKMSKEKHFKLRDELINKIGEAFNKDGQDGHAHLANVLSEAFHNQDVETLAVAMSFFKSGFCNYIEFANKMSSN